MALHFVGTHLASQLDAGLRCQLANEHGVGGKESVMRSLAAIALTFAVEGGGAAYAAPIGLESLRFRRWAGGGSGLEGLRRANACSIYGVSKLRLVKRRSTSGFSGVCFFRAGQLYATSFSIVYAKSLCFEYFYIVTILLSKFFFSRCLSFIYF